MVYKQGLFLPHLFYNKLLSDSHQNNCTPILVCSTSVFYTTKLKNFESQGIRLRYNIPLNFSVIVHLQCAQL